MSVSGKKPSVIEGRISAFSPDVVSEARCSTGPICTVSPRPKDGSTPSHTAKMRMRKMPMRKLGSDTPTSEVVSTAREVHESRLSAV